MNNQETQVDDYLSDSLVFEYRREIKSLVPSRTQTKRTPSARRTRTKSLITNNTYYCSKPQLKKQTLEKSVVNFSVFPTEKPSLDSFLNKLMFPIHKGSAPIRPTDLSRREAILRLRNRQLTSSSVRRPNSSAFQSRKKILIHLYDKV